MGPTLPIIGNGRSKPPYCYVSGCPLSFDEEAKGFCLGYGDPSQSTIAIWAEAPGKNEIQHLLKSTDVYDSKELVRRKKAYIGLPVKNISRGVPLVGMSGALLEQWILQPIGLTLATMFRDNTLRCLPKKEKNGSHYPVGKNRKEAERCCRHFDRWDEFNADIAIVTLHPAGLTRDITPLPLVVEDFKKAKDFASQGYRVVVLMGGKAAKACLGYAENVTKWRGHYAWLKKTQQPKSSNLLRLSKN